MWQQDLATHKYTYCIGASYTLVTKFDAFEYNFVFTTFRPNIQNPTVKK